MQEEVEALRAVLKDMKAKVVAYETALRSIASGPLDGATESKDAFADRAQALARGVLG